MFPRSEGTLAEARTALSDYRDTLSGGGNDAAQFDVSAERLRQWLGHVERQLGELADLLAASVGPTVLDGNIEEGTPWTRLDDVFFQARGSAWALLQYLNAARVEHAVAIAERSAGPRLCIVIRELEGALLPLQTPAIMNGGGYGLFANHSLVLGSYLSRAHAAVTELRAQLGSL
jgi:hypothetical protein